MLLMNIMARLLTYAARVLIIILLYTGIGLAYDPGERDTIRVEHTNAYSPGRAVIPVYFFNDEPLSAVELVIRFDNAFLVLDSFSLIGSRLSYIPFEDIISVDSTGLFDLWIPDWQGYIPTGNGLFCRLFYSLRAIPGGNILPLDSTTWPTQEPVIRTTLFSDEYAWSIFPEFRAGAINVEGACGDVTADNNVNILDILALIDYKFKNGPRPAREAAADVNHDGQINILDIIFLIDFKFKAGPSPFCH